MSVTFGDIDLYVPSFARSVEEYPVLDVIISHKRKAELFRFGPRQIILAERNLTLLYDTIPDEGDNSVRNVHTGRESDTVDGLHLIHRDDELVRWIRFIVVRPLGAPICRNVAVKKILFRIGKSGFCS